MFPIRQYTKFGSFSLMSIYTTEIIVFQSFNCIHLKKCLCPKRHELNKFYKRDIFLRPIYNQNHTQYKHIYIRINGVKRKQVIYPAKKNLKIALMDYKHQADML